MKKEISDGEKLKEKAKVLLENLLQLQKTVTKIHWRQWLPFAFLKPKLPLDHLLDFTIKQQKMGEELLQEAKILARKGHKGEKDFGKVLVTWTQTLLENYKSLQNVMQMRKLRDGGDSSFKVRDWNEVLRVQQENIKILYSMGPKLQAAYQQMP